MNLMKLHRILIGSAATLCLLFALREVLLILGSGGSLALALASAGLGLVLWRYFVSLRQAAQAARKALESDAATGAP